MCLCTILAAAEIEKRRETRRLLVRSYNSEVARRKKALLKACRSIREFLLFNWACSLGDYTLIHVTVSAQDCVRRFYFFVAYDEGFDVVPTPQGVPCFDQAWRREHVASLDVLGECIHVMDLYLYVKISSFSPSFLFFSFLGLKRFFLCFRALHVNASCESNPLKQ